ncbi:MAG: amidinotransferase [Flavobacteriaceae bacterium]|nr:amidinotransferase [Flavobacteriaceae bacterium]
MNLNIKNETSRLKTVVLGQSLSMGKPLKPEETYDAKSYESVKNNEYPSEVDIVNEMTAFEKVLTKHGIEVLKPTLIENYNQIFARDVAFAIDDKLIISNMIGDRVNELSAYREILEKIPFENIIRLPENARMEGGDVILCDDTVFCGVYKYDDFSSYKTARTNLYGIDFLREIFPNKTFVEIPLKKNDTDPYGGILHLDCTFMPVGKGKAVFYKDCFTDEKTYPFLLDFFGKENIFEVTREEIYYITTNVFSISPEIVVSEERFTRLNCFLEQNWHLTVEKVPYFEVSKMGGLFRCSTLPLIREDEK